MIAHNWIKQVDLLKVPDLPSFGAMWANGENKIIKKGKKRKVVDLSRKFPYIINKLYRKFNFKTYLEIGVAYGGSFRLVKNANKKTKMYGIDPMQHPKVAKNFLSRNGAGRGGFDGSIFQDTNVYLFETRSDNIDTINFFRQKSPFIDFLNIDGEHTYDACLNDLTQYVPCVKKGGIIWVDDVAYIKEIEEALKTYMSSTNEDVELWDWSGKGYVINKHGIDGVFLLKG